MVMKGWVEFTDASSLRTGKGRTIAQHGELFQGKIEDDKNNLRHCLMSLPCRAIYSEAAFEPDTTGSIQVNPPHKQKACKVAQLTLAYLNAPRVGGQLSVQSEVPEGKGCGSSTADCVAAAKAAADAVNSRLSAEQLARLLAEAGVTGNSFIFPRAVLFAHREGVVVEDYWKELPKVEVLGIDTVSNGHSTKPKHAPLEYSWKQLQSFHTLVGALRWAVRNHDIRLLGKTATASANINQEHLPKPILAEIRSISEYAGALGVAVAHSGSVVNILLDPQDEMLEWKVDRLRSELNTLGISQILRFGT
jgi:uncharacterized protein involved in propanediol utilization